MLFRNHRACMLCHHCLFAVYTFGRFWCYNQDKKVGLHDNANDCFDPIFTIRLPLIAAVIIRLCEKTEKDPAVPRCMETVRNAGYQFKE
ncbi:MAG: hypothetical protein ACI4AB_12775 [Acetatifactor sp.]